MTFDFQPYLSAIAHRYSQQRDWDTPTSALLPLDARVVQRQDRKNTSSEIDSGDRSDDPVEQLPVLEGLRKYALGNDREHVLLTGRPGSGKSTALQQLVVSLAEGGQVPVLVPLKVDQPVPELIRAEFRRVKPKPTLDDIDDWLLDDRLVLLLDGINEIPNEDLRRQLARFREENPTTPMIFTTRDLAVGGDLGVERRLEIQPLKPKQVQIFVGQYLPEHGDKLLRQLGDRLRELAETPLLLKLLCDMFYETGAVPKNKGDLFRQFDQDYEHIKQEEYVSVSENFWEFKSEVLQYLAFSMIQADEEKPTEAWLTIPQSRAELILEDWLRGRGVQDAPKKAKLWLKDLRRHHLLQDATKPKKIEFHHQLFQDYYAAEYLLQQLPELLKGESRFKYNYLNYLKWTESIALMLSLVDEKDQALHVVKLAMNVDLMLGARLAGKVKKKFQSTTVSWINNLEASLSLKGLCWIASHSEAAIPGLLEILNNLHPPYSDVCFRAVDVLGDLGSEAAILGLLDILDSQKLFLLRGHVIEALGKSGNEAAIPGLLKALNDPDHYVRNKAEEILSNPDEETATSSEDFFILCEIGHWLLEERLNKSGREADIPKLLEALKNPEYDVRLNAVETLGKLNSEIAIQGLLEALNDSDFNICVEAATALSDLGHEAAIPKLLEALKDPDSGIRNRSVKALGNLESEAAISGLLEALKDPNPDVRSNAAEILGKSGREAAISGLLEVLKDPDSHVRPSAPEVLGISNHREAFMLRINESLSEYSFRQKVVDALGNLGSEAAIPRLLEVLNASNFGLQDEVAKALGKIGHPRPIALFWQQQRTSSNTNFHSAISAIQNRCKFYNYEVWQEAVQIQNQATLGAQASSVNLLVQLDRIEQVAQATYKNTDRMANEPKNNFSGAAFHGPVNFGDNPTGDFIGTQNRYAADPKVESTISELKSLLNQLQDEYPQVETEAEALNIIDVEFTEIQRSPGHKLAILRQQLLNPERHLQASKATLAEVAKHYLEESVWAKAVLTYLDKMSETPDQGA